MKINKGVVVFADADFLSSFLRIGLKEFLIEVLKDNEIRIPYTVAEEIRVSSDTYLVNEFNDLVNNGDFIIEPQILVDTEEFEMIIDFVSLDDPNYPEFGEGELEALVLAYFNEGYIASNNLKHIRIPCEDYKIKYFSSIDILKKAYKSRVKSLEELDSMWIDMQGVQKLPPYNSFSEYLDKGE